MFVMPWFSARSKPTAAGSRVGEAPCVIWGVDTVKRNWPWRWWEIIDAQASSAYARQRSDSNPSNELDAPDNAPWAKDATYVDTSLEDMLRELSLYKDYYQNSMARGMYTKALSTHQIAFMCKKAKNLVEVIEMHPLPLVIKMTDMLEAEKKQKAEKVRQAIPRSPLNPTKTKPGSDDEAITSQV